MISIHFYIRCPWYILGFHFPHSGIYAYGHVDYVWSDNTPFIENDGRVWCS